MGPIFRKRRALTKKTTALKFLQKIGQRLFRGRSEQSICGDSACFCGLWPASPVTHTGTCCTQINATHGKYPARTPPPVHLASVVLRPAPHTHPTNPATPTAKTNHLQLSPIARPGRTSHSLENCETSMCKQIHRMLINSAPAIDSYKRIRRPNKNDRK